MLVSQLNNNNILVKQTLETRTSPGCALQQVAINVDFKVDESYTPNKISIRAGNSFHDLRVPTHTLQTFAVWQFTLLVSS